MNPLDRAGIFKAKPVAWSVRTRDSGAVAVSFTFQILAQLEAGAWTDWTPYGDFSCYGDFYVVKKDGTVNTSAVEQLVKSLGWNGDLRSVTGAPPDQIVQIQVKEDVYEGKTRYKAAWMNPGDYAPEAGGASSEDVGKLQVRFGSLLRAAAASAAKAAGPAPAKATAPSRAIPPAKSPAPTSKSAAPTNGGGASEDANPFR